MTQTRQQLEAQIADDLARSDLTTQIGAAVDTALKAYRFERLGFNEAYRVTATASVSADYLALSEVPTRFRKIDRLRLVRTAGDYLDLYRRDYEWIMSRQDAGSTCQPQEYAIYNDKIMFDSIADATYTLLIDGIQDLSNSISASYSAGDAGAWFNIGRELIRHRAKREVYAHVLKDPQMASMALTAETDALRTLKADAGEMNSTGTIRPTEF